MAKGYSAVMLLLFFNILGTISIIFNIKTGFAPQIFILAITIIGSVAVLYSLFTSKPWAFALSTILFAFILINHAFLYFMQTQIFMFFVAFISAFIGFWYSLYNIDHKRYPDEQAYQPSISVDVNDGSIFMPKN